MFPGIGVRQNSGSFGVDPFIPIGVIEMPVSVNQMFDRPWVEATKRIRDLGLRAGIARIDKQLAIRSSQDRNIPTGADERSQVSPQNLGRNVCVRRLLPRHHHDAFVRGEEPAGSKPLPGGQDGSGHDKVAARNTVILSLGVWL